MRIATWNINSVRLRAPLLLDYLREQAPDVLCLQEIKCQDEQFPREEIESAGYNCLVHGQKSYNGVAILSRRPAEEALRGLPGETEDEQARYLEAVVPDDHGGVVRVASLYLPNGNPAGSDKEAYKLRWMARLEARARELLRLEERFALAGDYNVIPEPRDAKNPENWEGDALYLPEVRAAFRGLENLGLTDALRATSDAAGLYTFWDYQGGSWQRDNGVRIDHILLSPQAADRLRHVAIDRDMRAKEKPSDHVPLRIDLDVATGSGKAPPAALANAR